MLTNPNIKSATSSIPKPNYGLIVYPFILKSSKWTQSLQKCKNIFKSFSLKKYVHYTITKYN